MHKRNHFLMRIHELDKSLPSTRKAVAEEYLCLDGKAQIDIALYKGIELFHPLSMGKQKELSREIYDYIDAKLYTIPTLYPIRICFHGRLPDGTSPEEISDLIEEHYSFEFRDKKEDLRINRFKIIALTILGIVLLAGYFALEWLTLEPVFMEFLIIAGWFSLWEAVDSWVLERKTLKIAYLNAGQSALSEITFEEE